MHILDIVENSIRAEANKVEIIIVEDTKKDLLTIEIKDNGQGMDKKTLKRALDPFFTTKKARRYGLGLPLLSEAAKAANGKFFVESKKGKGTVIKAQFQHSHIDRQPLGDISQTLFTLILGSQNVDFIYSHRKNGRKCSLDTRKIRAELNGTPFGSPEGIKIIRDNLHKIEKKLSGGKNE